MAVFLSDFARGTAHSTRAEKAPVFSTVNADALSASPASCASRSPIGHAQSLFYSVRFANYNSTTKSAIKIGSPCAPPAPGSGSSAEARF